MTVVGQDDVISVVHGCALLLLLRDIRRVVMALDSARTSRATPI